MIRTGGLCNSLIITYKLLNSLCLILGRECNSLRSYFDCTTTITSSRSLEESICPQAHRLRDTSPCRWPSEIVGLIWS